MVCVRMTMIGCAMGVISQHLDHPAIGDLPACTLHDHAFQFGLEGLKQPFQPRQRRGHRFRSLTLNQGSGSKVTFLS